MLPRLKNELNVDARNAAALMAAIQKSHQEFVPELLPVHGMCDYTIEFFKEATTAAGLKVLAYWKLSGEKMLGDLLMHPHCSICTLDFSLAAHMSTNEFAAFEKNSSVKTWQRCPVNFKGLQFIGLHVRELKLCSNAFSDTDMQNLQTVLRKGNIESVGLEAEASAEHLRLAKAVQYANSHGGRVYEVHLFGALKSDHADRQVVSETLEILCKSGKILSVALPVPWMRLIDVAALKDWLEKGSVESLKIAHASGLEIDAVAYKFMAELRPVLTNNRQLAAMPMGTAFGTLFWGPRVDAFGMKVGGDLTRRDWYAVMIVNKRVYIKAMQIAHERQAETNQSALVPYAPASSSPGVEIDALIQAAIARPFPQLGIWLAEGLRQHAVKPGDLDALDAALHAKCAVAIDAAFNDVETARRNELQTTSQAEAQRIAQTLFQPDSFATPRDLREHLALALAGPVPTHEEREEFKKKLLFEMKAEFARMFEAIVD